MDGTLSVDDGRSEWVADLRARQFRDWRTLRFEDRSSKKWFFEIAKLAESINRRLERSQFFNSDYSTGRVKSTRDTDRSNTPFEPGLFSGKDIQDAFEINSKT